MACVFDIQALTRVLADRYRSRFGVVPRFRVGMHGGVVVASEIGDEKREIVYFGDTVNTAARLGALCKKVEREFLISASLLRVLPVPGWVRVEPLGQFALEGKAEALEVCALDRVEDLLGGSTDACPRAP